MNSKNEDTQNLSFSKEKKKKSKVNESSSPEGRLMRGEEECDL